MPWMGTGHHNHADLAVDLGKNIKNECGECPLYYCSGHSKAADFRRDPSAKRKERGLLILGLLQFLSRKLSMSVSQMFDSIRRDGRWKSQATPSSMGKNEVECLEALAYVWRPRIGSREALNGICLLGLWRALYLLLLKVNDAATLELILFREVPGRV